jgi:signal transduction histidine kinase
VAQSSAVRDHESARLAALKAYRVLDTAPTEPFDRITALAADLFAAPIALVSLVDAGRQWFKSSFGLASRETPRDHAFCAQAVQLGAHDILVVPDASLDPRFKDTPLVAGGPKIRFYAGAVLTTPEGHNLGTLCVIDHKPRPDLTAGERWRLQMLARLVFDELTLLAVHRQSEERQDLLEMAEAMSGVGRWRQEIPSGRMTWSDELYRIHGASRDEYDPNTSGEGILSEDALVLRALTAEAVADGTGYETRLRVIRADGDQRTLALKAACEFDPAGAVIALVGIIQDVTDQVRALDAARGAVQAKSEFMANMSHELRTPLTSVIGYSDLLGASENLPPNEKRFAERIHSASEALLHIVNDVLDFSKLEAGAIELDTRPFDVEALVRGTLALVEAQAAAKGLTLTCQIDDTPAAQLVGDEDRIRQVLLNLIGNAVKFTAKGGISVSVGRQSVEDGRVELGVAVTDTGIGIDQAQIDRLFERFSQADTSTTRKFGGTGLGLAISRRLVEIMGGQIGASGEVGRGSTFWFQILLDPAPAVANDDRAAQAALASGPAPDKAPRRRTARS